MYTLDVSFENAKRCCKPKYVVDEFYLKHLTYTDEEFFFVDPEAKLSKVAPEGWKEDPKKKKSDVPFNVFLRIKFFIDDVNFIQWVYIPVGENLKWRMSFIVPEL